MSTIATFRRRTVSRSLPGGRLVATAIVVAILAGCAFSYDPVSGRYGGAVGCVNLSGPGFTLACPETLQAPTVPNTPQPTPQ